MSNPFHACAITLFPEMFPGPLGFSLAGKGLKENLWQLSTLPLREFGKGVHRNVDDTPYGGGAGMVMRADVLAEALDAARAKLPHAALVCPSPRGAPVTQSLVRSLVQKGSVILLCGRFEGIDQRLFKAYPDMLEVNMGDMVLSGGEIPALALIDACVRLLPGVMGNTETLAEESFSYGGGNLLEYPHYTRPAAWRGMGVPEILVSGDHKAIENWRLTQALALTNERRKDLWTAYESGAPKRPKKD